MGINFSSFSIRGIDTSTYNGVIDWSNMPAHFAAHRVGYGRTLDNKFNINWANCKINKFGYWYMDYYNNHISTHPVNGMSDAAWGKEQAENCYKFMGCNDVVFLDIESTNGSYAPKIETVRTRVLAIAKAFLIRIDQLNGKKNGIYCSLGLLDWFDDWFKDRPLWVAWYPYRQYNTSTSAIVQMVIDKGWKVKPLIWQYASDGIVNDDGIKAGITYFKTQMDEMDLNGWVGTQAQYESMFSTNVITDPIETPDDEVIVTPPTAYTKKLVNVSIWSYLNIRAGASTSSKVIGRYLKDAPVNIESVSNGWAKLYGQPGYVYDQYLK